MLAMVLGAMAALCAQSADAPATSAAAPVARPRYADVLLTLPVRVVRVQGVAAASDARVGIHIPVPEARQVVFRYLRQKPVVILSLESDVPEDRPQVMLRTLGAVTLEGGAVVGAQGPEHLRIGDLVEHGAVQNATGHEIRVMLSDGSLVQLGPQHAFYIGADFYGIVRHPADAGMVEGERLDGPVPDAETHTVVCVCVCMDEGGQHQQEHTFPCGPPCYPSGNQCLGLDQMDCVIVTPDGRNIPGKLHNCAERVVPIE